MTLVSFRLAAVLAAVLATACTAVDDKAPVAEPKAAPEYRTGSNIPVKEPKASKATTDEERAQAAEQLRQMQQGGAAARP